MRTIYVENIKNNKSVISYIKWVFPSVKNSVLFKSLRNKDIRLNDQKINKDTNISLNDKIDIYISDTYLFDLPKNFNIVYEDENILIINKPQGILSNIENFSENDIKKLGGMEPTLENLVQNINSSYKICHRLDRNTSGLVIFAKNDMAYQEMLDAFKNGYIIKEYIAYVANSKFSKSHDTLEKYIVKQNDGFSKIYDNKVKNSKKIITEYQVLSTNKKYDFAILKVIIHTGKMHQIRAQLSQISHPIIGDSKYGKNETNKKFKIYKQLLFAVKYTFKFESPSPMYYLNDIVVLLDDSCYKNRIG